MAKNCRLVKLFFKFAPNVSGAGPASHFRGGAISGIFASQVSVCVHYCKKDEVYFTTLLWRNNGQQNDLISRMLFSELYKIMVKKVTFIGFRAGRSPQSPPPWIRPWNVSFLLPAWNGVWRRSNGWEAVQKGKRSCWHPQKFWYRFQKAIRFAEVTLYSTIFIGRVVLGRAIRQLPVGIHTLAMCDFANIIKVLFQLSKNVDMSRYQKKTLQVKET